MGCSLEIYRNLQALQASFSIFSGNFYELVQALAPLQDSQKSLPLCNYSSRENLESLLDQTSRLFHNFLASAFSLIDHMRVIIKKLYSETVFKDEYQTKLEQDIISQPIHGFIKRLRNYVQHNTLPILDLKITFANGDLDFSVKMDVKILKEWKEWCSAKSYLDILGDSYCIGTLASEYFNLIEQFYIWLTQRQQSIHQSDIKKLQKMHQDLNS